MNRIEFEHKLKDFVKTIQKSITSEDGQWSIKGFIDLYKNVYTISADTKIVSKILEIHIFPQILKFANNNGFKLVLAQHQNYYPDISFVKIDNEKIKFAVDLKTTYRNPDNPNWCNGFTLGSHGEYFEKRTSTKNIQFPYNSYQAHFCLGIIYDRADGSSIDETKIVQLSELKSITSVIKNFDFFISEKWKLASDGSGSGNTANIGSIKFIPDIISGNGVFSKLGEKWFDDYWINYKKISVTSDTGEVHKITTIEEFVKYRKGDSSKIVKRQSSRKSSAEKQNE